MPDQDNPVKHEVVDDGNDVLRKRRDRELGSVFSRLSVPGKIEPDNAVTRCKVIGLSAPDLTVATPTVHEDQRRFSMPFNVIADRNAVV